MSAIRLDLKVIADRVEGIEGAHDDTRRYTSQLGQLRPKHTFSERPVDTWRTWIVEAGGTTLGSEECRKLRGIKIFT